MVACVYNCQFCHFQASEKGADTKVSQRDGCKTSADIRYLHRNRPFSHRQESFLFGNVAESLVKMIVLTLFLMGARGKWSNFALRRVCCGQ